MIGHVGSSVGSYLANPTSPIPSHCAVIILFNSKMKQEICEMSAESVCRKITVGLRIVCSNDNGLGKAKM